MAENQIMGFIFIVCYIDMRMRTKKFQHDYLDTEFCTSKLIQF